VNLCYLVKEMSAGKDMMNTNTSFALIQLFHLWYIMDLLFFEVISPSHIHVFFYKNIENTKILPIY